MTISKCDRCGYEAQAGLRPHQDGVINITIEVQYSETSTNIDLCQHCIADLKTFFKSDKQGLEVDL